MRGSQPSSDLISARRDQIGRIAGTARRLLGRNVDPGDGPGRGDHLPDREPIPVAEVEDPVLALARAGEREQMRGGEIVDVDVVANRCAVWVG